MTQPLPHSQKRIDGGTLGGPLVVPNCVRTRFAFVDSTSSRVFLTFLDAQVSAAFAVTPAIVDLVFNPIAASYNSHLATFQPTNIQMGPNAMQDIRSANNTFITGTAPTFGIGTSASASLPHELAVVITKRTSKAGAGFRGRMYIPGWATNADQGDGTIAPTLVTAMGLWVADIMSAFNAQGMTPCIGHRHRQAYIGITGTEHDDRPAGTQAITILQVRNNTWDSQRKRGEP